jgi:hypothetical protein
MSKPDWGFDAWYAQLDPWNRTIIYASQLKKYLLSVGYNKWGDINLECCQDLKWSKSFRPQAESASSPRCSDLLPCGDSLNLGEAPFKFKLKVSID